MQRCWFLMAFEADGRRCEGDGLFGLPSVNDESGNSFAARSRWCEVHRHEDDIWIGAEIEKGESTETKEQEPNGENPEA